MKLLVERNRRVSHAVLNGFSLLRVYLVPAAVIAATVALLASAAIANQHVKLCDLVRVLAWGGDLDRACPVEVAVAQSKSQLLNLSLLE